MGESTKIAWCDATFNIAWGCVKVSPGCANCYAENLADVGRMAYRQGGEVVGVWGKGRPRRTFGEKHWNEPLKWSRDAAKEGVRKKVFCSSMTDVFMDDETIKAELLKLWPLIQNTPWLDWMLLTKRSDRIAASLPADWSTENYPNVWLGVSIENAEYAFRADDLRKIDAVVRFISYEPALGSLNNLDVTGIDLVLYGGESGNGSSGYRPEDKQWARDMHKKCYANGTAFFHKQSAANRTEMGIELDGRIVRQWPNPRYPDGVSVPGYIVRTEDLIIPMEPAEDKQRNLF